MRGRNETTGQTENLRTPPELDFKRWQLSQITLPQTRAGETWKHRVSNVTSTESQTSQDESQTPALLTVGYRLQGRNHFLDTVHVCQEKWNMKAGTFPGSLENLLLLKQPFKSLFNIPLTVVCRTLRRAPSRPAQESKASHQTWT